MHVEFVQRQAGPERLICEADLIFETAGPLTGLRLVGFSLWRGAGNEIFVTFPTRAFGVGSDRRYFNYLRGDEQAVERFKRFIVDAFNAWQSAAPRAQDAVAQPRAGQRRVRSVEASPRASNSPRAAKASRVRQPRS